MLRSERIVGCFLACLPTVACGARSGLDVRVEDHDVDAGWEAALDVDPRKDTAAIDRVGLELSTQSDVPSLEAPTLDVAPPRCGNARIEEGEDCDWGVDNALVPAFRVSSSERPMDAVQPVVRTMAATTFYRYMSASAHTGFERVEFAHVFLYVDRRDNALSLFFFAGRDDDGSVPVQPRSEMEVWFRGVPGETQVVLSDDGGEFARQPSGDIRGRWNFEANTDGGVLSRLPWERPWRLVVEPDYRAGIRAAYYLHRDGRPLPLPTRSSFVIEHFVTPARCRPDCRLPRCGDGFVDAGERCDDGNTLSGDGCASNCQRIE
jgi:cysteine-rich repeat protein